VTKLLLWNGMNLVISRSGFGLAAVASFGNVAAESDETHKVHAAFTLTGT
jgi:hypothetical protein